MEIAMSSLIDYRKLFIPVIILSIFSFIARASEKPKIKYPIVYSHDIDGSQMLFIKGGVFIMGNNYGDRDEKPVHRVELDSFYLDRFEVTNVQYEKFVKETGHAQARFSGVSPWNAPLYPVVGVSWNDARDYAAWAGKRLPTEAEWEYAARGTDGREWPWGNLWHEKRGNSEEAGTGKTARVGSFPEGASPFGILDMAGNVWEWCLDSYDREYYRKSPLKNPAGPPSRTDKVLRGGSWGYGKENLRSSNRFMDDLDSRNTMYGFRLVMDASRIIHQ
ncbi:MAG: formylglycine-generating enzyme family protein [bacterium]